jgi:alkylation response protein AidB-like acyl-CoA dehydrogenase
MTSHGRVGDHWRMPPLGSDVRTEVRAWIEEAWDPERPLVEWRRLLADSGWAVPSWPVECYGRGLPAEADAIVAEELTRAGAVGVPVGVGIGLAAPTILAHGSPELKPRLLHRIVTGEDMWCQLFSEPGSGSDLAGLTTRADRDGDEWIISGQKVWNTSAHHAQLGLLLARTNWDATKHEGITCFAIPMQQVGVEVRPLRQMNGHASFNEVFFSEARVPAGNVIGEPGDGWRVAVTTLMYERRGAALQRPRFSVSTGRTVREAVAEADEYFATYSWYPQRAGRADLVADAARAAGVSTDALVRQRIASVFALQRVNQWTAARAAESRALGRPPGPEGSLAKLAASNLARASYNAHALIASAQGLLTGPQSFLDGVVAEILVSVPAVSIAGGTDEIQRNIIGERVLGLPKEPQVDRDIAFRSIARNSR